MYVLDLEASHDHLLLHVRHRVAEFVLPQHERDLVTGLLYEYLVCVELDLDRLVLPDLETRRVRDRLVLEEHVLILRTPVSLLE